MGTIDIKSNIINLNVEVIAGDTLDNWSIQFSDSSGVAYDVSDIDFYYVIKPSFSTTDEDSLIVKNPEDAVKSASNTIVDTVAFPLSATETQIAAGNYVHAMKIIDGSSEYTWMTGTFKVLTRKITSV